MEPVEGYVTSMAVGRRYSLKARRAKELLTTTSQQLKVPLPLEDKHLRVERVDLPATGALILLNDEAAFIQVDDEVFPTLLNAVALKALPSLTVDMGAVPYICNGADVMAPGLVKIEGDFAAGDIVVVVEERFAKPIAVVKALVDARDVAAQKRGKVAITRHYIGDRFWEACKRL